MPQPVQVHVVEIAGGIEARPGHRWSIFHDSYSICSSMDFGQSWTYRGKTHELHSPGSMLMEPGELHCTKSMPGPVGFTALNIPVKDVVIAAQALDLGGRPHLRQAACIDPRLRELV